ncbi:MAG TPA: hypothetical protein VF018_09355 [Acidobacteriaceae bacterium]
MRSARIQPSATVAVVAVAFTLGGAAGAQQPAQPSPAKYTGCVQGDSASIVLRAPNLCAVLKGKVSASEVAGHQIELTGVLSPATKTNPATIQVESVSSVGQSCTETCAARPRGRGLHPTNTSSEVPGSEGGTPGAPMH